MSGPIVAVLHRGDLPPHLDRLAGRAEVRPATHGELADALDGADVLFQWHSFSTALAENFSRATSLEWMHVSSAGVDSILFDDLVRSGVTVTNSGGVLSTDIAEFVLGLVIDVAKDSQRSWELQRTHTWRHRATRSVAGRRVVVVGTGSIGREITRLLRAVGMDVAVVGRTARQHDPELGAVTTIDDLPAVIRGADHLVLAVPLTARTRSMVDASILDALGPGGHLINVGRGELVDTDALVAALADGRVAGAALDVVDPEPLPPEHPLWSAPGVVITPHMSGDSAGYLDRLGALFVENFDRYVAGEPLRNVVDKELGYVRHP